MKKFFLAYLIAVGIPLFVLFTGIGSPEFAGFLVLITVISCLVIDVILLFAAGRKSKDEKLSEKD